MVGPPFHKALFLATSFADSTVIVLLAMLEASAHFLPHPSMRDEDGTCD